MPAPTAMQPIHAQPQPIHARLQATGYHVLPGAVEPDLCAKVLDRLRNTPFDEQGLPTEDAEGNEVRDPYRQQTRQPFAHKPLKKALTAALDEASLWLGPNGRPKGFWDMRGLHSLARPDYDPACSEKQAGDQVEHSDEDRDQFAAYCERHPDARHAPLILFVAVMPGTRLALQFQV